MRLSNKIILQYYKERLGSAQTFLKTREFTIDSLNSVLRNAAFAKCVLDNIRDTTYKLKFVGIFKQTFFRDIN